MGPDLKRPKQKNSSKVLRSRAREREQTENSILNRQNEPIGSYDKRTTTPIKATNCKKECEAKITVENIFCENIVSRYQTLVSSLPQGTVFLHRRPKTDFITGKPSKKRSLNKA